MRKVKVVAVLLCWYESGVQCRAGLICIVAIIVVLLLSFLLATTRAIILLHYSCYNIIIGLFLFHLLLMI